MDYLLVRYGDIGSKSYSVRNRMAQTLRQRVEDRLRYEEIDHDKVSLKHGRVLVEDVLAEKAADKIKELPGVSSVSPAYRCKNDIEQIKKKVLELEVKGSFGVDTKRSAETEFDSMDVNREIGAYIQNKKDLEVDLDDPDSWIRIEVRENGTFIFSDKLEGPDGFPAGTSGELAALISGGIDSPVAAYEVMKRGADITPVYFYNRPLAAEDHLIRFEEAVKELKRFNPSRDWSYYLVDFKEVNEELMEALGRGRMVIHRMLMFKVAEKIAEKEGLQGIVTGESMGQKSSQTASNLEKTSGGIEKPIYRPLLTSSKSQITGKARDIGTYELSEIDSACRTMAPDNPATSISQEDFSELLEKIDIDALADKAFKKAELKTVG